MAHLVRLEHVITGGIEDAAAARRTRGRWWRCIPLFQATIDSQLSRNRAGANSRRKDKDEVCVLGKVVGHGIRELVAKTTRRHHPFRTFGSAPGDYHRHRPIYQEPRYSRPGRSGRRSRCGTPISFARVARHAAVKGMRKPCGK